MKSETTRLNNPRPKLRTPLWRGLMIGFPVLIALILASGIISAELVGNLREQVIDDLEREHLERMDAALKLRDIVSEIYIDAHQRPRLRLQNPTEVMAYKSVPPELDADLKRSLEKLRPTKLGNTPEWQQFEHDLTNFLTDAVDPVRFGIYGFQSQKRVVESLNTVMLRLRAERGEIAQAAGKDLQRRAQRDILITTFISLIFGLLVAGLSVREIQSRFRDLQRSYRALEEAREFTRTVINSSTNAIFTLTDIGELADANTAFYQLLSINPSFLGLPYREVLDREPKLLQLIEEANSDIASSQRRYRGRIEIGDGNEEPRRLDIYVSPLLIDELPQGLVCTLIDVTETERAQQEIQRNRALAAVGQITAQVAHEIKNPLGGIKLNISYLQKILPKDETDGEVQEILGEFSTAIERLGKIVNELNQFARPRELTLQPTDINQLIDQQLALVADKLQQKKLSVVKEYQLELPAAPLDSHELSKAFINLIINAVDASPEGRQLKISTRHQQDRLVITIADQGVGMSKETLAKLFEPFFTTKTQGTGLGMSISKRVIELHSGKINIRSSQGQGTTIIVELPLKQELVAGAS